jgi:hypothetical protein
MSKDQRRQWSKEIPRIEFAINTTVNSSTGFSPFQLENGVEPLLPMDLDKVSPEASLRPATKQQCEGLYADLTTSMKLYREVAEKNSTKARQESARRLNATGTKKEYKVGDKVMIYMPPKADNDVGGKSELEPHAQRWKAKHKPQWRGPCTVMERLSNATYKLKEDATGTIFQRSVRGINKFPTSSAESKDKARRAPEERRPAPAQMDLNLDQQWMVGDLIAVKDEPDDKKFWIAEITEKKEGDLELHYYIATTRNLEKTRFRPSWIETSTGRHILDRLHAGEKGTKWTGLLPEDNAYIITKVQLKKDGRLTAATIKKIRKAGITHHIL